MLEWCGGRGRAEREGRDVGRGVTVESVSPTGMVLKERHRWMGGGAFFSRTLTISLFCADVSVALSNSSKNGKKS